MSQIKRERKNLYVIGWGFIILGLLFWFLLKITHISLRTILLPCLVHSITGLYCPGCGGTRAFSLFMQGQFLESLYYHPVVFYGMGVFVWFMISNSIELVSKGRWPIGLYYRDRYIRIAVVILIINFVIKNLVLIVWNYPMIA